jgi:hypothetical protein
MSELEKLVLTYRNTQRKSYIHPKCAEIQKQLTMLERSIDKMLNDLKTKQDAKKYPFQSSKQNAPGTPQG